MATMDGLYGIKSKLAKLLATENIIFNYNPNTVTAYFDIKDRVLTLPVWNNISNELHDMLIVHEVGHALDTPFKEFVSSIDTIAQEVFGRYVISSNLPLIKDYLNVVEDARIDRRQQRRYPGTKKDYNVGYAELHNRDFFGLGISKRMVNELPFIDRANVYFKGGLFMNIKFNEKEKDFIRRMNITETYQDVVDLTKDILLYEVKNSKTVKSVTIAVPGEAGAQEGDGLEVIDFEGEGKEKSQAEGNSVEGNEKELEAKTPNNGAGECPVPESQTTKAYEKSLQELAKNNGKGVYIVDIPKFYVENIVEHYNVVIPRFRGSIMANYQNSLTTAQNALDKWRKDQNPIISFMVKEFEMKKNADRYARTQEAKTGMLNMTKIQHHKYRDDLFKRVNINPEGKNHGFVMLLDWSSSMNGTIRDTLKQLFTLVLFCKRVQIPFEVYLFRSGNHKLSYKTFYKVEKNHIALSPFALLNVLSSKMSSKVLYDAMSVLYAGVSSWNALGSDSLSGTPLNQAILCFDEIVNKFQKANKVQIVSAIVLTDGCSDPCSFQINEKSMSYGSYENVIVRDWRNAMTYNIPNMYDGQAITRTFLQVLKNRINGHLIGFYLTKGNFLNATYAIPKGNLTPKSETTWGENGFIHLKDYGYDEYYILNQDMFSQKKFNIKNSDLEADAAFTKRLTQKNSANLILRSFIDRVSRDIKEFH